MTRNEIEERRLRRLEKRICHLTALLRVTAIFGGRTHGRAQARVRELLIREHARLWEMFHPDGEPEDIARKETAGNGSDCGHLVDK